MAGKKAGGNHKNVRVLLTILGVIAILAAGSVGYAMITGRIGGKPSQDSAIEESKSVENSTEASKEDISKPDSSAADSSKTESSKTESSKTESSKTESSKEDSSKDDSSKQDSSVNDSSTAESSAEDSKEESSEEEGEESTTQQAEESSREEEQEESREDASSHETTEPSGEQYSSDYLVRVNLSTNVVTVYAKDSDGSHTIPVNAMLCSPGPATPIGTFEMAGKWRYLELVENMTGQYISQILGDYLFHTVPSYGWDNDNVEGTVIVDEFRKQGTSCSHGCIRLYAGDAAWMYYNTVGNWTSYNPTMIEIGYFGAGADPWGTPAKLGVPGYYTDYTMWDPTDPSDSNPWKHPSIEIPEDQQTITLNVGDSVPDIDVKGYDGCGYDISGDISISSNVNLWSPGDYTITYSLTNYYGYSTSKSVSVTVKSNPVTGVEVDGTVSVEAGSKADLTVKVLPENASNQYVLFASEDESVATVDENGTVTGVAAGTTTIVVTSDDNSEITAKCTVTVTAAPEPTEESSNAPAESSEESKENSETPSESSEESTAPEESNESKEDSTESKAESSESSSEMEESSASGTGSSEAESTNESQQTEESVTESTESSAEQPAESSAEETSAAESQGSAEEPEGASSAEDNASAEDNTSVEESPADETAESEGTEGEGTGSTETPSAP